MTGLNVDTIRPHRTRFRFIGSTGGRYYWHADVPGDSRVYEVSCPVGWFWAPPEVRRPLRDVTEIVADPVDVIDTPVAVARARAGYARRQP